MQKAVNRKKKHIHPNKNTAHMQKPNLKKPPKPKYTPEQLPEMAKKIKEIEEILRPPNKQNLPAMDFNYNNAFKIWAEKFSTSSPQDKKLSAIKQKYNQEINEPLFSISIPTNSLARFSAMCQEVKMKLTSNWLQRHRFFSKWGNIDKKERDYLIRQLDTANQEIWYGKDSWIIGPERIPRQAKAINSVIKLWNNIIWKLVRYGILTIKQADQYMINISGDNINMGRNWDAMRNKIVSDNLGMQDSDYSYLKGDSKHNKQAQKNIDKQISEWVKSSKNMISNLDKNINDKAKTGNLNADDVIQSYVHCKAYGNALAYFFRECVQWERIPTVYSLLNPIFQKSWCFKLKEYNRFVDEDFDKIYHATLKDLHQEYNVPNKITFYDHIKNQIVQLMSLWCEKFDLYKQAIEEHYKGISKKLATSNITESVIETLKRLESTRTVIREWMIACKHYAETWPVILNNIRWYSEELSDSLDAFENTLRKIIFSLAEWHKKFRNKFRNLLFTGTLSTDAIQKKDHSPNDILTNREIARSSLNSAATNLNKLIRTISHSGNETSASLKKSIETIQQSLNEVDDACQLIKSADLTTITIQSSDFTKLRNEQDKEFLSLQELLEASKQQIEPLTSEISERLDDENLISNAKRIFDKIKQATLDIIKSKLFK